MAVDKWVGGDLWTAVHALIHGHDVIVHNSTAEECTEPTVPLMDRLVYTAPFEHGARLF